MPEQVVNILLRAENEQVARKRVEEKERENVKSIYIATKSYQKLRKIKQCLKTVFESLNPSFNNDSFIKKQLICYQITSQDFFREENKNKRGGED